MAKKKSKKKQKKSQKSKKDEKSGREMPGKLPKEAAKKLPKEVRQKLKGIKSDLDKFSKTIIDKFDKYILGVALLPPPKPREGEKLPKEEKDKIHVLVLVDDSDSQKMSKMELKNKLSTIIDKMASEINKDLAPQTLILSELWQACHDGKYELLRLISMAAPVHDTGMLSAIKLAEVHKQMVLKKFEKYIVSYVMGGSFVQGKPNPHDIDVYIVIDDTDVKKMTRAELKDKLRAIIIGMAIEAGEVTGIKGKLHVQVYILTDFWNSLKEANPVILTLLRDSVPFYDRGIFVAWKQLLKMGKIKPSQEAIDLFMSSGDQMIKRVDMKLKDIGMEDIFYALLTPTQAALMLYGVPPPIPREAASVMREILVKKEGLIEEKYAKILEDMVKLRKDIEYGKKEKITGKDIDDMMKNAKDFLKRIKKLFEELQGRKESESMIHIYDTIITIVRDVLKMEGVEKIPEAQIEKLFNDEMVSKGHVPAKFARILKDVVKAKKDYEAGKLTKQEVETIKKSSGELIKFLIEYMQRKRGLDLEKTKIRVKYGDAFGEVILLGDKAFIVQDIDDAKKGMLQADITPEGGLGTTKDAKPEDMEKYLADAKIPKKVFIKERIFEDLKKVFGKDVEVLVNF